MKQLLFVGLLALVGTAGVFAVSPFCGVAVYYLFAVLRPQYIWEWSLPRDVQWSRYVALATIAATLAIKLGLMRAGPREEDRTSCPVGRTQVLYFLFFAWVIVSYFTARNREAAEIVVTDYLKIFAMLAVSSILVRRVGQLWILTLLAALSLGYIAYEVNSLYFTFGAIRIYHNGYGGLDNNGAGLMIAMGLPLCVAIWDGAGGRWRWAFLALVPAIAHAVMMTYSRGAMLSLVVIGPLVILRCRHRKQIMVFALLFIIGAIPILAGPEIRERFLSISGHEQDESAQSRKSSWAAAWAIAQDNPIFGVGPRNANLFSHQYGADMEGRTIHSQYLQIAADNGFIGLGLYLAVLVSVWSDTRRVRLAAARRDDEESSRTYAIATGVETSLAVFCFGGAFLSLEAFELPYLLLFLGSQLARLEARREKTRGA